MLQTVVTVLCSFIASTGFWSYVQKKDSKKDNMNEMLIGLGHDRIVYIGMNYINRGYITQDEYENLYNYLYIPYKKMGGNGSAERVMNEVNKLELRR